MEMLKRVSNQKDPLNSDDEEGDNGNMLKFLFFSPVLKSIVLLYTPGLEIYILPQANIC